MAPVNGVTGKPPKTVARPPNKTIIPVLPLNFPQRPPAPKQPSAPPNASAPKKVQNCVRPAGHKTEPHVAKPGQEALNGNSTELGPSSMDYRDATTPSAAPIQAVAKAAPAGGDAAAADERDKETPTVSSTFPDRRISAATHRRPPGFPNPAPEGMGTSGPVPGGPIPVAHPALAHRSAFHQPHPSNGSMVFGGFYDSNTSSPAPRSGGGFPPPGLMPYPPPAVDAYGRPLLVSPAVDGFPPNLINPHGSPTPHSFHGSQSSAHAEEHGFSHYPPANSHLGHPTAPAGQGQMPPPGMNPPVNDAALHGPASAPAYPSLRDQDEALSFLRHGISDNTFNDCILEVRFSDSQEFQDHPAYRQLHNVLRTHGHRFILSRSPMLAGVMKAQGTVPGGIIFLEVKDDFMRSDVFWYSLRTLYGWSLADGLLPTELPLRDVRDDLKTALSYVATARYLQLPWVHSVAVHRASRLLFWNTIELAVKFVSQIVAMSPPNDGYGIRELLEQVLSFIIHNFPPNFSLDANAGDYGFPRFPPSSPLPHNPNAPTIANGTSGGVHSRQPSGTQAQLPRNPRLSSNLRLSQIKFGDISPPKEGQAATRAPNPTDSVLSRILLNVPFELLKQILEHPHLGKSTGELNAASRQSIITDVIAERESRRLRTLEKTDPQLRVYQDRAENAPGPVVVGKMDDFWVNNIGFKEEVFPGDLPYLVHTWSQGTSASS